MSVIDPVAEGRCDCCDLPAFSCGKAAEQRATEERQRLIRELLDGHGYTRAQWAGACATCGEWFKPGDPIKARDGRWAGGLCCGDIR